MPVFKAINLSPIWFLHKKQGSCDMEQLASDIQELHERIHEESAFIDLLRLETSKAIVGQKYMIDRLLLGLLAQGHILLEGFPDWPRPWPSKTLAASVDARFSRLQFTPDLLPADLVGYPDLQPEGSSF